MCVYTHTHTCINIYIQTIINASDDAETRTLRNGKLASKAGKIKETKAIYLGRFCQAVSLC